ncbi:MAG: LysM peptidoglycan-binding domain-containing protein [Nitrospira sp. SB0661_bin_20]|nr:LysM peptidoglycan-binding domain-containing protein [Nitrospira sp. SB0661_bin_20]
MKVKVFLLCLSGVFFGAGGVLASGVPQLLPDASSSQLPAPASSGGLMYFSPDPRPDSITHVPLTPALSHQGRGGYMYEAIPVIVNPAVERNIHYFQNVIHDRFQEWLIRFYPYRPLIEQIFIEFGLPKELVYLSLVESGFNPRAYSRAHASGPWQFIKSTGRIYGLTVNWYVDERRDPIKSTVAAARHLRDLYDLFGSWPLALASYNAGPGKISRAMKKTGSRDFWTIARTRYIRRETKQYVPRFMAAMIIATRPSLFGFRADFQPVHEYEEIHVDRPIHLRSVSKEAGLSFEELRRLNPELRRNVIPSDQDGYFLKVPVGTSGRVEQVKTRLKTWTSRPSQRSWYRVRWGDSLSVIARRFGTSVRQLKHLNGLSGNVIRVGQRLRVNRDAARAAGEATWYRVRRGDSLSVIARRFGTSVRQLKHLNGLSGNVIRVGQRLRVNRDAARAAGEATWYRVRRGDSLSVIARRFGTSVRQLKHFNGLSGNAIRAGQHLRVNRDAMDAGVVTKAGESTWYRVRRGDNLSVIAHRFGTNVRQLKHLNDLSGNVIRVGQRLRVNRDVTKTGEVTWYRVRMGDSLWSIAKRFRVSVKDLKVLNNLRSSLIRVGRRLMIAS